MTGKRIFFIWHYFHQCNRSCLLLMCILCTQSQLQNFRRNVKPRPYRLFMSLPSRRPYLTHINAVTSVTSSSFWSMSQTQNRQWTNLLSMHLDGSMMLKLLPESGGRDSGRSYVQSLSSSTRPPAGREDEDVDTIEGRVIWDLTYFLSFSEYVALNK